jgi:hypothetical protein
MAVSMAKTTKMTVGSSEVLLTDFDREDLAKLGKVPALATAEVIEEGTARDLLKALEKAVEKRTLALPTLLHDCHYERTLAVVQALKANPMQPIRISPLPPPEDAVAGIAKAFTPGTRIDHSRASIEPTTELQRNIADYFRKGK